MSSLPQHIPVLTEAVLEYLKPERGGVFVDGTLGLGGHAESLLNRAKEAEQQIRLIGIDRDPYALEFSEERLGTSIEYLQGNYSELGFLRQKKIIQSADGILLDLGVSSYQIDTPERGFAFTQDGPLDMRMDQDERLTAAQIVNTWQEHKLVDIFLKYGEERLARKIAHAIVERRGKQPFKTTLDLAEFIRQLYPTAQRYKKLHPAARVFQGLRIEVNKELEHIEAAIPMALDLLAHHGVLVVISFHSLEDRIIKYAFREAVAKGGYEILTKKPVMPEREEELANPRSRSSKLRAIRRLEVR